MCRGTGECALRAPASFALGADDKSTVVTAEDSLCDADPREAILAASRACPHFAISVFDGGKRVV